jgi:DNA-binding NarL/FixJ family response regulator
MPATPNPIRVLLIDDHVVMRMGLRLVIEHQPGLEVAGEAANRADALAIAAREQPDIILLDLDLGDASDPRLVADLAAVAPAARVIVVTGVRDSEEQLRAVSLGALGLVRKEQAADVLVQAIERVYAGEAWLDPALVARVLAARSRPPAESAPPGDPEAPKIAKLTAREREVVGLICEGLYSKQIAQRLSISEATVSHHLTSIFAKLGLANRFDLVVYAYRHGLAGRR